MEVCTFGDTIYSCDSVEGFSCLIRGFIEDKFGSIFDEQKDQAAIQ